MRRFHSKNRAIGFEQNTLSRAPHNRLSYGTASAQADYDEFRASLVNRIKYLVRRLPWALMLHDLEGNVLGFQACAQLAGVLAMHESGIGRCVIPACVQDKQR